MKSLTYYLSLLLVAFTIGLSSCGPKSNNALIDDYEKIGDEIISLMQNQEWNKLEKLEPDLEAVIKEIQQRDLTASEQQRVDEISWNILNEFQKLLGAGVLDGLIDLESIMSSEESIMSSKAEESWDFDFDASSDVYEKAMQQAEDNFERSMQQAEEQYDKAMRQAEEAFDRSMNGSVSSTQRSSQQTTTQTTTTTTKTSSPAPAAPVQEAKKEKLTPKVETTKQQPANDLNTVKRK